MLFVRLLNIFFNSFHHLLIACKLSGFKAFIKCWITLITPFLIHCLESKRGNFLCRIHFKNGDAGPYVLAVTTNQSPDRSDLDETSFYCSL